MRKQQRVSMVFAVRKHSGNDFFKRSALSSGSVTVGPFFFNVLIPTESVFLCLINVKNVLETENISSAECSSLSVIMSST